MACTPPPRCIRVLRRVVHCCLPGARCVGGECPSVLFVWWGILRLLPPRRGGGWGYRGWWGVWLVVGGMAMEGRWCQWLPVLSLLASLSACWCPPRVCVVAVLNGGSGVCCDAPCSDWVRHLALSCPPLRCLVPLTSSRPSVCLLSQHCWFRVVSLCQGCVIVG